MLNSKQSSTVYGAKFMEFRKTFQNFNANSNKALNILSTNTPAGSGPYSGNGNPINIAKLSNPLATQYGTKFSDAFNKKGSFTGVGGVYGNELVYNSLKKSNAVGPLSSETTIRLRVAMLVNKKTRAMIGTIRSFLQPQTNSMTQNKKI